MKNKKTIIIITVVVLGIISLIIFRGNGKPSNQFIEVQQGRVAQEVSVSGTVKPVEEVNLRFETNGTIEKIYVSENQEIKQGDKLVKLYTGKIYNQFLQAQASYNQARAELEQFIAGATQEEIQIAKQVVENAETTLEGTKAKAENDLIGDYNDAVDAFDNAYFNADKAMKQLETIFDENTLYKDYRSDLSFRDIQAKTDTKDKKDEADIALEELQKLILTTQSAPSNDEIDETFDSFLLNLRTIRDSLNAARSLINLIILHSDYSQTQWDTDKANIETGRTSINAAITNTISAKQAVNSQKITNQINVNTAENTLANAKLDLEKKIALPRKVDIAIYQAKVDKARASFTEAQQKLSDATLRAPIEGIVTNIDTKIGETVIAGGESVVSLISSNKFQIEADIYEEDIVKIKAGDLVDISIIAFPDEILKGQVISINPSEKIIDKVVYYGITINFNETRKDIKPMMTADLVIKTASRENVLFVLESAIQKKDNKFIVQVLKDGLIEDREVEIGLIGSDNKVEIISGLEKKENVIIK